MAAIKMLFGCPIQSSWLSHSLSLGALQIPGNVVPAFNDAGLGLTS
jgi:hypothetical protein